MNTHSRRCIPDILNVCSSRADSRQIILFHRSKGHCSGCTSLLCIFEHRRPPCAVAIHKTCTDQQRNRFQNSALVKDQRSNVLATHHKSTKTWTLDVCKNQVSISCRRKTFNCMKSKFYIFDVDYESNVAPMGYCMRVTNLWGISRWQC